VAILPGISRSSRSQLKTVGLLVNHDGSDFPLEERERCVIDADRRALSIAKQDLAGRRASRASATEKSIAISPKNWVKTVGLLINR
jgi:hypothetical protein